MIKKIFNNINKLLIGGITVVFLLFVSIIIWVFPKDTEVNIIVVVIILIICYMICIVEYAILKTIRVETYNLPSVKRIIRKEEGIILLVEKSDLFEVRQVVTISYQAGDDELEIELGCGVVESINSMGNLQIRIKFEDVYTAEGSRIYNVIDDNAIYRSALKVKPGIIEKDYY